MYKFPEFDFGNVPIMSMAIHAPRAFQRLIPSVPQQKGTPNSAVPMYAQNLQLQMTPSGLLALCLGYSLLQ